ncbi:glycosyltransferase involved in cell wall biosynthesis [Streptohalobacillus salinus]|uniref:Glycosyltransferase involved in cell wall biosynthesis n=1 Tax=Streptohalobacillus salinus TaxID=621096 RepID=A0A2V3WEH8_9BACI|nr:glycosyltransferase family 4 protein [Streptohalobacillus salinus]PXW92008.1 glycosyltransferase involved in cell wall biosynthesis [Streptohalobacillus salinus]
MKKILYVAPLVAGFQDILEGSIESKGLPSFILPLKKLQESKEYTVDIVLVSKFNNEFNIKVDWINKENIVANINNDLSTKNYILKVIRKAKSSFQVINSLLKLTKKNKYEVIYCHGKAAVWGNFISIIRRIPCAYRVYGTVSVYEDLKKYGKLIGSVKHPIYTLIFKLPKKFLMITDDGSQGDKVYELMKPKTHRYPFYFLLNGVDHQSIEEIDSSFILKDVKYLFHAGRIDPIKRQDRNIEILKVLKDKGYDLKLYLSGHFDEESDYYKHLVQLIKKFNLEDRVKFLGPIDRDKLKAYSYYSVCTLLMGDISNTGNVFYEVFSTGSIVVGLDGIGLRKFIENNKNGYLVNDNNDAVFSIEKLLNASNEELNAVRSGAIRESRIKLENWDKRVNKEIDLLTQGDSVISE